MSFLVSIIVPCYNQAQYLPETLQSVLDQTYTNWECIIVNDGSPDETESVAQEWCKKDGRFVYLKKENGGLSSARNAGLKIAKGDYIQFLDSDDYLHSEKLEQSVAVITTNTDLKLVVTDFKLFSDSVNYTKEPYCILNQERLTYESILYGWGGDFTIPIHCGLFHKDILLLFGFDESYKAIEDWIMWLNFFKNTKSAAYLNQPLAYYRFHEQGMTKNNVLMQDSLLKAYQEINNSLPEDYSKEFSNLIFSRLSAKIKSQQFKIIDLEYQNSKFLKLMLYKNLKRIPILKHIIK